MTLEAHTWPVSKLEEALDCFAIGPHQTEATGMPRLAHNSDLDAWLYAAAAQRSLEALPLRLEGAAVEELVQRSAPCLLLVRGGLLVLREATSSTAHLISPQRDEVRLPIAAVCEQLAARWEHRYSFQSVEPLLAGASVDSRCRPRLRSLFLAHQLRRASVDAGWAVRPSPTAPMLQQLRGYGVLATVGRLAALVALAQAATVASWYLLSRGVFAGSVETGWLWAWALALGSTVALEAASTLWQGKAAIGISALMKRRLMLGALRIEPEHTRHEGLGVSMGRVLQAEGGEIAAVSGSFQAITAAIEVTVALGLLAAVSWALFLTFAALLLALVAIAAWQYGATLRLTEARLALSHDLVERLVGHRTRALQERPDRWHTEEDLLLARYAEQSRRCDQLTSAFRALIPRSWLVLGLFLLVPHFVSAQPVVRVSLGLGAVLLAQRAFTRLSNALASLVTAGVAWKRAAPLFEAARRPETRPTRDAVSALLRDFRSGDTLLCAKNLSHQYRQGGEPALEHVSLELKVGEQALVEGPSGSGKSTLISLLAGHQRPTSGVLLMGGLDPATLGASLWRRRVVAAPQSHENHLLQGSLAFNLLFGREWPATAEGLAEARELCRELGLQPLLERMPEGLNQPVGSVGWRLSHGERSRVFIARALLQRSELVILDESFAALDPQTLELAMACARRRARSLLVVAHP